MVSVWAILFLGYKNFCVDLVLIFLILQKGIEVAMCSDFEKSVLTTLLSHTFAPLTPYGRFGAKV
jgi:hypothetical protein